jgi:hypothetical protein
MVRVLILTFIVLTSLGLLPVVALTSEKMQCLIEATVVEAKYFDNRQYQVTSGPDRFYQLSVVIGKVTPLKYTNGACLSFVPTIPKNVGVVLTDSFHPTIRVGDVIRGEVANDTYYIEQPKVMNFIGRFQANSVLLWPILLVFAAAVFFLVKKLMRVRLPISFRQREK